MTKRFPTDRLTPWRQRFIAIARELETEGVRRRATESVHAIRGAYLARGTLRGVRLGCARPA
jgi:hypothetical protein